MCIPNPFEIIQNRTFSEKVNFQLVAIFVIVVLLGSGSISAQTYVLILHILPPEYAIRFNALVKLIMRIYVGFGVDGSHVIPKFRMKYESWN